jgi:serine/threonine-protein kinase TNNI3K
MVDMLIERGAEIGSTDYHGLSALHVAALTGHALAVRLILNRMGALADGLDRVTRYMGLALFGAVDHSKILRLFLGNRYDPNSRVEFGDGTIGVHREAFEGYTESVQLLLDYGATVHAVKYARDESATSITPLMLASELGHEAVVQVLLENCNDPKSKFSYEASLALAKGNGHNSIMKLLIRKMVLMDLEAV